MIPAWNISGVLPPIRPDKPGNDTDRSPYIVNLHHVVNQFATSPDRIAILHGLLNYRKVLHDMGIVDGFQWLDGSFFEHIEMLECRPPSDMDVVTFLRLPVGVTQESLYKENVDFFNPNMTKVQYRIDGYISFLGEPTEPRHVKLISYWYSMWSHRRNLVWKGFIQVDLSPDEDIEAIRALELLQAGDEP
jgi:hypothetical protein